MHSCNHGLLISGSASIQPKFPLPGYTFLSLALSFSQSLSINYSDVTNLSGRAQARDDIIKIQNRLNSLVRLANTKKIKLNKCDCRARLQDPKFTCTDAEWLQRKAPFWQQFIRKGFCGPSEAAPWSLTTTPICRDARMRLLTGLRRSSGGTLSSSCALLGVTAPWPHVLPLWRPRQRNRACKGG